MISIYNFYLFDFTFEIIYLITFLKFFNFVYIIFKLNILSNYAKHLKKLAPCYILPLFTILKFLYPIDQLVCLKNDFSLRKKLSYIKKLDFQGFY